MYDLSTDSMQITNFPFSNGENTHMQHIRMSQVMVVMFSCKFEHENSNDQHDFVVSDCPFLLLNI